VLADDAVPGADRQVSPGDVEEKRGTDHAVLSRRTLLNAPMILAVTGPFYRPAYSKPSSFIAISGVPIA